MNMTPCCPSTSDVAVQRRAYMNKNLSSGSRHECRQGGITPLEFEVGIFFY